jgi:uncharacterized membrane protein
MGDVIAARALHVIAVVIWIGGVAMATTVMLPAVRRRALGPNPLQAFEAFERRFVWQARAALIVVGLTGFYMTSRLNLWGRFQLSEFWWMHAMVFLWLLFAFVLLVAEPFIIHRRFHTWATAAPDAAFARLQHAPIGSCSAQSDHYLRGRRRRPRMVPVLEPRFRVIYCSPKITR